MTRSCPRSSRWSTPVERDQNAPSLSLTFAKPPANIHQTLDEARQWLREQQN